MATPHKSIFVHDDDKQEFNDTAAYLMEQLGIPSYSKFSRDVVLNSTLLTKQSLSDFAVKEARKLGNYRYLVLTVKTEK
jgi:hypothetical protein